MAGNWFGLSSTVQHVNLLPGHKDCFHQHGNAGGIEQKVRVGPTCMEYLGPRTRTRGPAGRKWLLYC